MKWLKRMFCKHWLPIKMNGMTNRCDKCGQPFIWLYSFSPDAGWYISSESEYTAAKHEEQK